MVMIAAWSVGRAVAVAVAVIVGVAVTMAGVGENTTVAVTSDAVSTSAATPRTSLHTA
jgi:hypothetical protein